MSLNNDILSLGHELDGNGVLIHRSLINPIFKKTLGTEVSAHAVLANKVAHFAVIAQLRSEAGLVVLA